MYEIDPLLSTATSTLDGYHNMNSTSQDIVSLGSTDSWVDEPEHYDFIERLFGPNEPNVPVRGTGRALDELLLAVQRDGLFVQLPGQPEPVANIKVAYQHLQRKGVFPQTEQLRALHALGPRDGVALGIGPEDYVSEPAKAAIGIPPFKTLNVDRVLKALRIVARYFNQDTSSHLEDPWTHAYQLGIVTRTVQLDGRPEFKAQLYLSQYDVPSTATLWLYRQCTPDGVGSYNERWRALGDGTLDVATLADAPIFASTSSTTNYKARKWHETADEPDDHSPTSESNEQQKRSTKRQRRDPNSALTADEQLFEDEQLFMKDPRSIIGPPILRLAHHCSNTELFERTNEGHVANRLSLIANSNVITRRITLAIKAKVRHNTELTVQGVREELNEARVRNGVKARMDARRRETRAQNAEMAFLLNSGGHEGGMG